MQKRKFLNCSEDKNARMQMPERRATRFYRNATIKRNALRIYRHAISNEMPTKLQNQKGISLEKFLQQYRGTKCPIEIKPP
jgi:hypothetical protein